MSRVARVAAEITEGQKTAPGKDAEACVSARLFRGQEQFVIRIGKIQRLSGIPIRRDVGTPQRQQPRLSMDRSNDGERIAIVRFDRWRQSDKAMLRLIAAGPVKGQAVAARI